MRLEEELGLKGKGRHLEHYYGECKTKLTELDVLNFWEVRCTLCCLSSSVLCHFGAEVEKANYKDD